MAEIQYGVTPAGFVRKRLDQIQDSLFARLDAVTWPNGQTGPVNRGPDSAIGQLVNVVAVELASVWEGAEGVYYSKYPSTAIGASLDNAVSYSAVRRKEEVATRAWVTCYGQQGTVIPKLSKVAAASIVFQTDEGGKISANAATDAALSAKPEANASYTLVINGQAYQYQSSDAPTVDDIVDGLVGQIDSAVLIAANVESQVRVTSSNGMTPFSISAGTPNLSMVLCGSPVQFLAVDAGPYAAPAGEIDEIKTPVYGWESCINLADASPGRHEEQDPTLRLRYTRSVFTSGSAHLDAIVAAVLATDGVLDCIGFENVEDVVVEGVAPHSVEILAVGGADDQIAAAIAQKKAAGIDTNGMIAVEVPDQNGHPNEILFNRPTGKDVWLRCEISLLDEEEFPGNGVELVRNTMLVYGRSLGIGHDVVLQRFMGPIYRGVAGIAGLAISAATGAAPPLSTDYSTANVAIAMREQAEFAEARILVTVVGDG